MQRIAGRRDGSAPEVFLSTSSAVVSTAGERVRLGITCQGAWRIEGQVAWCDCSATSGSGDAEVEFVVRPNTDYEERRATYFVLSGRTKEPFQIVQKQVDALTVTSDKVEVGAAGGEFEIEVEANIPFEYEIGADCRDWIVPTDTRALERSRLRFRALPSEETGPRGGTVTIKSGSKSESVAVYQAGSHILLLTQEAYTVSSEGGAISLELRSNVRFSVQDPVEEWIEPIRSRAASTHTLRYRILPNDTHDSRTARIVITDDDACEKQTVTVTQLQQDAIIVAEKQYSLDASGGEITARISSNVAYTVTKNADWIVVRETRSTRGLTTRELHITVAKHTGRSQREGTVTVSDGKIEQTIRITQQGIPDAAYQIRYTTTDGKPISIRRSSRATSTRTARGSSPSTNPSNRSTGSERSSPASPTRR